LLTFEVQFFPIAASKLEGLFKIRVNVALNAVAEWLAKNPIPPPRFLRAHAFAKIPRNA